MRAQYSKGNAALKHYIYLVSSPHLVAVQSFLPVFFDCRHALHPRPPNSQTSLAPPPRIPTHTALHCTPIHYDTIQISTINKSIYLYIYLTRRAVNEFFQIKSLYSSWNHNLSYTLVISYEIYILVINKFDLVMHL